MALAEATVRVYLDLIGFERELKQRVEKAANEIGRDFDRDMRRNIAATGRTAGLDFRDGIRTSMGRAGVQSAHEFATGFRVALPRSIGNAGNQLGRQLRVSVGRAGTDAGARFCQNLRRVMANCGRVSGREFVNALRQGVFTSNSVGSNFGNQITTSVTPAVQSAGRKAGREFSLSFGLGTARAGRPVLAAFAVLGSEIATKLGPALPVIASFPPLLTGVAAAALITGTAFKNVGDAIQVAFDPTATYDGIRESMLKLGPAAQRVVEEFRQQRVALGELRGEIQDAFFGQLAGQVTRFAQVMTGPLNGGVVEVATSMGRLGRSITDAFLNIRGVANLRRILRGTTGFVDELAVGFGNLLRGFLDFSGHAAPGLTSLGEAINSVMTRWGQWLTEAGQSGRALEWIEGGLNGLRELGSTLVDIAGVFAILVNAAQPLALMLGGVFDLVVKLVGIFGELPGPLQTAALAAVLFARSGLPDFLQRTTREGGPLTRTLDQLQAAYRGTAREAQAAALATQAAAATGAGAGATQAGAAAMARQAAAQAAMSATASQFARNMQGPVGRAMGSTASLVAGVGNAIGNTMLALDRGLTGATVAAGRAAVALGPNMVRATKATASGALTVARAAQNAGDSFLFRMLPAALAASNAVQTVNTEARHFAGAVAQNTVRAVDAVTNSLRSGLYGGLVDAQAGLGRVSTAMSTGLMRGTIEADAAMTRLGTSMRTGLAQAVDAAGRGVVNAGQAVANTTSRFVAAVPPLNAARDAYRATTGALNAFAVSNARAATAVDAVPSLIGRARDSFAQLTTVATGSGAALRAGFASAATSVATAVRNVTDRVVTSIGPLNAAREAYRSNTEQLRAMNAMHTQFVTSAGQAVAAGDRLRTTFSNMGVVIAGTGSALRAGFDAPITAARNGLTSLGTVAAGTGRVITTGLSNAMSGLMGVLGGPWGLALAGAGIALSLFASEQDKARQAAAAHDAALARLGDTLDRTTGAVTQATVAELANTYAKGDLGAAAKRLEVPLSTLVKASVNNADAQNDLNSALRNSARGALENAGKLKLIELQASNLGVPLNTLIDAFLGNASAMDAVGKATQGTDANLGSILKLGRELIPDQAKLGVTVNETADSLKEQGVATRDAVGAMGQAQVKTSEFATAIGLLGSNASDADTKTKALTRALQILAGDTIDAQTAQANFTETLLSVNDGLADAAQKMDGAGKSFINANGAIDNTTERGAKLVGIFNDINGQLSTTAVKTAEAGQKNGDLQGAYQRVAADAERARETFVKSAMALGATEAEANAAATAMGLIPKNVVSVIGTLGTGQVTIAEVQTLHNNLRALPPNTPVRVQGLTEEARAKIIDLGNTVVAMPDGHFEVYANTAPAQGAVDQFVRDASGKIIFIKVMTVDASGNQVDSGRRRIPGTNQFLEAQGHIVKRYASGGLNPMPANYARIVKPNTWRVIGDRAFGDEAFIPINRSARSRALLRYTAERMGFDLFAKGGISGRGLGGGGGVAIAQGAIVVQAPFSDPMLVAKATLNELARSVPV